MTFPFQPNNPSPKPQMFTDSAAPGTSGSSAPGFPNQGDIWRDTSTSQTFTLQTPWQPYDLAPLGLAIDAVNNLVYSVAGNGTNRILVVDVSNSVVGFPFVAVIGQPDTHTITSGCSATKLNAPNGLCYDASIQKLFVADTTNNRVLMFDVAATPTTGMAAVHVFGQTLFTTAFSGCTATTMHGPQGVAYDSTAQLLFVADTGNNRVLVYDLSGTITNGMAATAVLGQADFTHNSAGTTSTTMDTPNSLCIDNVSTGGFPIGRLFVADTGNFRVLMFGSNLFSTGDAADHVIGQLIFTTKLTGLTQKLFGAGAVGVDYDSSTPSLIVSDLANNRVMFFDANAIADGMNATAQYNQANFTSAVSGSSLNKLHSPAITCNDINNSRVFIADKANNRLVYGITADPLTTPLFPNALVMGGWGLVSEA